VTCAPQVPCGTYANQIFESAGITVTPDSFEENVKAVVTKVTLGEADAGIAYATDVMAAGDDADGVEIPADINVVANYPIAVTAEAGNGDGGRAFVDFVTSDAGQEILTKYGFTAP
jgi:molybdate transport system substrate-binding protein